MEFKRGGDIRETIGVGLSAGAYEIFSLEIRIGFNIKESYKHRDLTKNLVFDIKSDQLEQLMEMLDSKGLNLEFNDKIMELSKTEFEKRGNIPRMFDMDNPLLISARFYAVPYGGAKVKRGFTYANKMSIPSLFETPVVFKEKLYEIKDDTQSPGYWDD